MEVVAEITSSLNRDLILKKLAKLKTLVDKVDIPEAPGGKATAHSLAVGVLAMQQGLEPIVHIRLLDVNKTGLKSLLGAARLLGLEYVVLLQGDPPAEGSPVTDVTTEEAIAEAKKMGLKAGALLSLRREYAKRLEAGADFYLALHFSHKDQLRGLPRNVYPYIIVETPKNAPLIQRLRQTAVPPQRAVELAEEIDGLVDAVIISAPGDFEALVEVLKQIKASHR